MISIFKTQKHKLLVVTYYLQRFHLRKKTLISGKRKSL